MHLQATASLAFGSFIAIAFFMASPAPAAAEVVEKPLTDLGGTAWSISPWNTAKGRVETGSKRMVLKPEFSGTGFEHFTVTPPEPLLIPGDAKTITVRYRLNDRQSGLVINFLDGWGSDKAGGKPMKWNLPTPKTGEWITRTFDVPANWKRPIAITSLGTHNYADQQTRKSAAIEIGEIQVETDISGIDPATGILRSWSPNPNPPQNIKIPQPPATPLMSVDISTGKIANLFAGESPRVNVSMVNWAPKPLTGKAVFTVRDTDGHVVDTIRRNVSVKDSQKLELPLGINRFGRYILDTEIKLSDGTAVEDRLVLASIPKPRELTEAQKMASPYGMNIHGAKDQFTIEPFKEAGIVWFRDYAFSYDWIVRAKGADASYAAWPYYPKLLQAYADAGVKLLPVNQGSIKRPTMTGDQPDYIGPPDDTLYEEIAQFVRTFPDLFTHWEVSNEYDLHASEFEDTIDWTNYAAYHRVVAEAVKDASDGRVITVENGRAGIWPERARVLIERGDFDDIGVINTHYYSGTDNPEFSVENHNMGDDRPTFFFDDLRAVKRVASIDGKPRESWLTEWGWDALAGPVVPRYEQAVYLPRAWMLMMAAGTDKGFWFFDYDAENPAHIFHGMGLLSADQEPNLVLCSLAGLTSTLYAPTYVGDINAGENTHGYVFENDGKLVASLWTVEGDDGPTVTLDAPLLRDYLGNTVAGPSVQLSMAPVYAIGLSKESPFYLQTAYSIDTRHLVTASPGQTFHPVLKVTNNRATPIDAVLTFGLPEGWQAKTPDPISVPAGETELIELSITVGKDAPIRKRQQVTLTISEADQPVKTLSQYIEVRQALNIEVGRLAYEPGPSEVAVTVNNGSDTARSGTLVLDLPASWSTPQQQIPVSPVQPGETREMTVEVDWSPEIQLGESASISMQGDIGEPVVKPLIPPRWTLRAAPAGLAADGRLDDWSDEYRVPNWMLGTDMGDANAELYLAWSPEGLYGAVKVVDSKLQVGDPKSFWAGDTLELFLDTSNTKTHRKFGSGDHQFWFVPLTEENRTYAGQWKRDHEIDATRFDLPDLESAAVRTDDGYIMEFLLPASYIQGYSPATGKEMGINLNLTVKGKESNRSVYWPAPKMGGAATDPANWGGVVLTD